MRETLKNIYDAYRWVRIGTWVGLGGAALLVLWLEGGFPAPIWIVLWQTLRNILQIWKVHGVAIILPILTLVLLSLLWVMSWLVLLRVALGVIRHHRGLKMRQARKAAWRTTRQIADLDAFALPGEHTLSLPILHGEDDKDSAAMPGPLIRLPQYTDRADRIDKADSTAKITQVIRSSAPVQPQAHRPLLLNATQRTREAHEQQASPARAHASNRRANVSHVAIEDIPTKPEPSTEKLAHALPHTSPHALPHTPPPATAPHTSAQRTTRLDMPAYTPTYATPKSFKAQPARATQATSASLEAGVGWHTGLTRQRNPNEDSVVVLRGMCTYREQLVPFGLFVVADGMGGHDCGQEASRIAIRTITQVALRDLMQPEVAVTLDDTQLTELLTRAVEQANVAIYRHAQRLHKDMGTTLTAALVVDTKQAVTAYVVNAGDSRTYLLGQGEHLQQITRDHSLVANLVAAGAITPDAVYTHPERNKVYRSLGNNEQVEIDWFTRELRPGDTLLLCSDGLWEMVRDPDIERILHQDAEPTVLCNQLIQAALHSGGADNVSAIVVKI